MALTRARVIQLRPIRGFFYVLLKGDSETWVTLILREKGLKGTVKVTRGWDMVHIWGVSGMTEAWDKTETYAKSQGFTVKYSSFQKAWEKSQQHLEGVGGRYERQARKNLDRAV